jgi:hypothetical protein
MVVSHVLLLSSLFVNTALAAGCASGFAEPARTPIDETYRHLTEEAVVFRQEAVDLRAAARYYEGEAQRSEQLARPEPERARRYRDFSQQASAQAEEADRSADDNQRQIQSL